MKAPAPAARAAAHVGRPLPAPRHVPLPMRTLARRAPAATPDPAPAVPITDAAVPEGHRGLHEDLYGSGGAEVHGAGGGEYEAVPGEDGGEALVPTAAWLAARAGTTMPAVFALYDGRRALQYVGLARHAVRAVRAAAERAGEERAAYVRAMVFANRAMATRAALQEQADRWLAEAGTTPPGNGVERGLWEGTAADGLTAGELEVHEGRKLKLQKAMGEASAAAAAGPQTDAQRRASLQAAVEGDDWSAVIDGQTAEAVGRPPASPPASPPPPPVTPFARAAVHRVVGSGAAIDGQGPPALTVEAAEAALDEVRPYLIADGGNVEVVGVDGGVVALRLQGACGTCPSSAATLSMGIERALRARFGDALAGVVEVGGAGGAQVPTSAAAVDAHLDTLRPAITAYGARVTVVGVEGGVCTLRFGGPSPIATGIVAAVRDRFQDLADVRVETEEE